ncbi:MAG: hypothetical protein WD834_08695 [Actinomycetota bacterium]
MRLYLIGEMDDAPLHVALETAVDLADGLAKIDGYRFVTRPELEALPHGRAALAIWEAGDDAVFEARTRAFADDEWAKEKHFDAMSETQRAEYLRGRLLAAGLDPAKVHGLVRERRRKGLRIADEHEATHPAERPET